MLTELQAISSIVPKHPTHPILRNVLIKADSITTSDLTHFVTAKINNPHINDPLCCDPSSLSKIIKKAKAFELFNRQAEDEWDTTKLNISTPSGNISLQAIASIEFPEVPRCYEEEKLAFFNFDQSLITALLKSVKFANHNHHYNTKVVFCSIEDNVMSLISSDGWRICSHQSTVDYQGDKIEFGIEPSTIAFIKKAQFSKGTLGVFRHDSRYQLRWETDTYTLIHNVESSKMLSTEGLDALKNNNGVIKVNRKDLIKAIELVYHHDIGIEKKDESYPVIILKYDDDTLNVRYQVGVYQYYDYVGEWEIGCEGYKEINSDYAIYNPKLLLELLKQCKDDQLIMKLSDRQSSCLQVLDDGSQLCLMPINPLTEEQIAEQIKEIAWIKYQNKLKRLEGYNDPQNGFVDYTYNGNQYAIQKCRNDGYQNVELIIDGESQGFFDYLHQAHKEAFNRFYDESKDNKVTTITQCPTVEVKPIEKDVMTQLPNINGYEPVHQKTEAE
jgi:DNA polymerase III sliding clamp (beta) subunit (PCNA family)